MKGIPEWHPGSDEKTPRKTGRFLFFCQADMTLLPLPPDLVLGDKIAGSDTIPTTLIKLQADRDKDSRAGWIPQSTEQFNILAMLWGLSDECRIADHLGDMLAADWVIVRVLLCRVPVGKARHMDWSRLQLCIQRSVDNLRWQIAQVKGGVIHFVQFPLPGTMTGNACFLVSRRHCHGAQVDREALRQGRVNS